MSFAPNGSVTLLQVFDMPEALAFYRDGLGFEVLDASEEVETPEGRFFHWCWLQNGPVGLMLNTAHDSGERPPARDPARQAAHGDIGIYIGVADIQAAHAALVDRGLDVPKPQATPHGTSEIALADPDGYLVHIQAETG